MLVASLSLCALSCSDYTPSKEVDPTPLAHTVTILIDASTNVQIWHRDVSIPRGFDAFQLTELVTEGQLTATWYPSMKTHYIESMLGLDNSETNYWMVFLWDESGNTWQPLPVGADWFSLKNGHILAWSYIRAEEERQPRVNPTNPGRS